MGKHDFVLLLLLLFFIELWKENQQIEHQSNEKHFPYSGVSFSLSNSTFLFLSLVPKSKSYSGRWWFNSWGYATSQAWNHFSVTKSDEPWVRGGGGSLKFAAEYLKNCQSKAESLKLPTDPDTLLSWKLYLLRQCWLTAFLFFSFLF